MRRRAPQRATLLRVLTIVLFGLLVAALVLGRPYLRRLQRTSAPIRSERVAGHDILLRELQDIAQLHTVEYRYRTVFPFDYMPPDISLSAILTRLRGEDRRYEDAITARERDYLAAYNLVERHGIGTRRGGEFVVLDVLVSAGFALDGVEELNGLDEPDTTGRLVETDNLRGRGDLDRPQSIAALEISGEADPAQPGRVLQVATVTLPAPTVTQVRVADIDPAFYPYPEILLTPAAFREIAVYVRERAERRVIERGILERAEESGRRAVEQLLLRAGFDRVEFAAPALYRPHDR